MLFSCIHNYNLSLCCTFLLFCTEEEEELELLAEVMDNAWADLKNPPKISIVIVPPKSTPKYQPRFEPTPLWKIPPLMRRSYKRTFRKVMK